MSAHTAFRRQPVQGQAAMQHASVTLPAPIRGLVETENWAYTKPGSAVMLVNWLPTTKGLKLRGGTERWAVLPAPVEPVRSGFEYVSGANERMFCATATRLFDISFTDNPIEVTGIGTITDGNFCPCQFANMGGDWLLIANDAGDYIRRYDGTTWEYLNPAGAAANKIVVHPDFLTGTPLDEGKGLTYVWKYRNRLFFIQGGSMTAWFLPLNAVGGQLKPIPLSGAAKRGGSLLFGASWSASAGDGLSEKCVFGTDQGELLVFVGTDPETAANWRQEGRYDISKPLGKNGHQQLGGDVLVVTVDGVVPISAAMQKDVSALSLAAITYSIEPTWMRELVRKDTYPWNIVKWDEGNVLFVNFPGGALDKPQQQTVAASNLHTGAWAIYTGWDAMCFMKLRGSLFFGTQDGKILQVESTGYDDAHWDETLERYVGVPYTCTMVGGWEMFQVPPNQVTWLQARTAFFSSAREPFQPQLSALVDYSFNKMPPPPNAGPDPGLYEVWDQGLWDQMRWDQPAAPPVPARTTMWVSIGKTGFSHAPVCQVTVGQQARPNVELVSISATFIRMAANV